MPVGAHRPLFTASVSRGHPSTHTVPGELVLKEKPPVHPTQRSPPAPSATASWFPFPYKFVPFISAQSDSSELKYLLGKEEPGDLPRLGQVNGGGVSTSSCT